MGTSIVRLPAGDGRRPQTPDALFACLRADAQQIFRGIADDALGGLHQFQRVFDAHFSALDCLNGQGLSHAEIGLAPAAVGVVTQPLTLLA